MKLLTCGDVGLVPYLVLTLAYHLGEDSNVSHLGTLISIVSMQACSLETPFPF